MNREGIIIIICIGIVVLFYLCQVNTAPVEQVDLVKEPTAQSADAITKKALKQTQKKVYSTTTDSLVNKENKGNQPK